MRKEGGGEVCELPEVVGKRWGDSGGEGRSSNNEEDSRIVGAGAKPMILGERNKRMSKTKTSVVDAHSKVLRFGSRGPLMVRGC